MAEMWGLASAPGDVLRPRGELDVLPYYSSIASKLAGFLRGRELASRIWTPRGRPSSVVISPPFSPPLYVSQLSEALTPDLPDLRLKYRNAGDAGHLLSPVQRLAWQYIPARRYVSLYYATNGTGPGREIRRVVCTFERCPGSGAEDALSAVRLFLGILESDLRYREYFQGDPFVYWTGTTFHAVLYTIEPQPPSFFSSHLEYTGKGRTMTDHWVSLAAKHGAVAGGTQRRKGYVLLDTSLTPSGRLCPVPLGCLQLSGATAPEGVSVPLTLGQVSRDIVPELASYTPGRVIEELDTLAARLPG